MDVASKVGPRINCSISSRVPRVCECDACWCRNQCVLALANRAVPSTSSWSASTAAQSSKNILSWSYSVLAAAPGHAGCGREVQVVVRPSPASLPQLNPLRRACGASRVPPGKAPRAAVMTEICAGDKSGDRGNLHLFAGYLHRGRVLAYKYGNRGTVGSGTVNMTHTGS